MNLKKSKKHYLFLITSIIIIYLYYNCFKDIFAFYYIHNIKYILNIYNFIRNNKMLYIIGIILTHILNKILTTFNLKRILTTIIN